MGLKLKIVCYPLFGLLEIIGFNKKYSPFCVLVLYDFHGPGDSTSF